MSDLQSRPYKPDPEQCCEACAFGRGKHAAWCQKETVWTSTGTFNPRAAAQIQEIFGRCNEPDGLLAESYAELQKERRR